MSIFSMRKIIRSAFSLLGLAHILASSSWTAAASSRSLYPFFLSRRIVIKHSRVILIDSNLIHISSSSSTLFIYQRLWDRSRMSALIFLNNTINKSISPIWICKAREDDRNIKTVDSVLHMYVCTAYTHKEFIVLLYSCGSDPYWRSRVT